MMRLRQLEAVLMLVLMRQRAVLLLHEFIPVQMAMVMGMVKNLVRCLSASANDAALMLLLLRLLVVWWWCHRI